MHKVILGPIVAACLAACGDGHEVSSEALSPGQPQLPSAVAQRHIMRFEAWSEQDSASRVGTFEYRIAKLPSEGEVGAIPWADGYYPTVFDSVNHLWAGPGSESPTRKYERAFDETGLVGAVRNKLGLYSRGGSGCASDAQCAHGSLCGKLAGESEGRCMTAWWGLNHGWAAASTLHPEPRHAVTHGGVTFEVQDIKALLALVYNRADTTQVSLRCQETMRNMPRDAAGRPTTPATRDTNPGTYHVLLTNLIGLRHQTLIEDGAIDESVWNRPLRGYEILQQQEINGSTASRILGVGNSTYPYNADAKRWAYVRLKTRYISPTRHPKGFVGDRIDAYTLSSVYEYVLELDASATIIGGEWVGNSKRDHPDFLWVAHGTSKAMSTDERLLADRVLDLTRRSAL